MTRRWWKVLRKLAEVMTFVVLYLHDLVRANLRIASDVVRPHYHLRPGVIAVPLHVMSDLELISLANLITMTPGTLTVDVSPDRRLLYIHAMYVDDVEALRREVKDGVEARVMGLFR